MFHGSTVPNAELVVLLRCFLIVIAANILTQLFASVTTGLQRLDLTHMMSAANVVLSALWRFCCSGDGASAGWFTDISVRES